MDASSQTPEQIGDLFGHYELLRLLGEGSMGRVYEARHRRLGRRVAIKTLRVEHAHDLKLIQRFFREAKTVNQINHEHIVEIFDFHEPGDAGGDRAYCVMEALEGETLAQALQRGPFPLNRALRITLQMCDALQAAHDVAVVHRDLKPDNIFLTQRPEQPDYVKLLDFGVAKLLNPDPSISGTADNAIVGTPQYMSPEQAASLDVDHRSDIYAVGALLYEMLTGRRAFDGEAFGTLLVQIITQPPEPLPAKLPSGEVLPHGLMNVVMRCLEKEPEKRPQSMAELRSLLLEYADPEGLRRAHRRDLQLRVGMGVGIAALLVAVTVLTPWSRLQASPSGLELVRVELRSSPSGARVLRADTGVQLGVTPLIQRFPRGGADIPIRVELDGHVPVERRVRLHSDLAIEVAMSPIVVPASATMSDPPAKLKPASRRSVARDSVVDPFRQ